MHRTLDSTSARDAKVAR